MSHSLPNYFSPDATEDGKEDMHSIPDTCTENKAQTFLQDN